MPYKVHIRDVTEDSLDFVCRFAKETGDFQGLSATDLKVIALAYRHVIKRGEKKHCRKKVPEMKEVKFKVKTPILKKPSKT